MAQPRLIVLQPTPYCNINCSYCYLGHRDDRRLMSVEVVEAIRNKVIARLSRDATPSIVWHAGEPTTAPLSWYEHTYARLSDVCPPRASFAMQSNGIAIDEQWTRFFLRTKTNVGLSIDGPQRFHDARRRTRRGAPTWSLAMRALQRLRDAGMELNVISVLHPSSLDCAEEYYKFYRDNGIALVSFSIDEREGANAESSFSGVDYKERIVDFLVHLLESAYRDGFPLRIREIDRVAQVLAGIDSGAGENEQVEAWDALVVAADGSVSTFSPELTEVSAPQYSNFIFGNILTGDFDDFASEQAFRLAHAHVKAGIAKCRSECRYFEVCGGGSPVNKICEHNDLMATETTFCRYSIQTAADALFRFLSRRGGTAADPMSARGSRWTKSLREQ
jgi:uncharacterized protein